MSYEKDLDAVGRLEHGERCLVNWFEESGGEVWKIHDDYIVYEVSCYGCNINFDSIWTDATAALVRCYEFT